MDLAELFAKNKQNYLAEPYLSLPKRRLYLRALRNILQENADELIQAVNKDYTYRVPYETLLLDIYPTISAINYCLRHLKNWTKKRRRHVSLLFKPAYAYLFPQPLGIIGIIVPWNYPLYLSIVPLAYALTAGNRVMVKMSELTPNTGKLLAFLIKNNTFLSTVVSIINGDIEIGKSFALLPFSHLLFTGSTAIGKQIMAAASKNLTAVTLELGGKSPAIIGKSINHNFWPRLFMGKLLNAGQTCLAPDYLLIPEGWEDLLINFCQKFIQTHYPGLLNNENYSCIISTAHYQRLQDLIDDCRRQGGRIVQFGAALSTTRRNLPFTLLFNVDQSMQVMQEEIFGPLLPVINYSTLEALTTTINNLPNPLIIYYFGSDQDEKNWLERNILSGGLTVNDTLTQVAINDLPFGGVGKSGMGQYHGREGFDLFSKLKPVFIQKWFAPITWFYPPYGRIIRYFLRWVGGIRSHYHF